MAKTEKNPWKAFASETQPNSRYLGFARAAGTVGLVQVARIFREAAEARPIQNHTHMMCARG